MSNELEGQYLTEIHVATCIHELLAKVHLVIHVHVYSEMRMHALIDNAVVKHKVPGSFHFIFRCKKIIDENKMWCSGIRLYFYIGSSSTFQTSRVILLQNGQWMQDAAVYMSLPVW